MRNRIAHIMGDVHKFAVDKGMLPGHDDYTKFIMLGKGRSGSNLLGTLLSSHKHIMAFGELFSEGGKRRQSIHWHYPGYHTTPELVKLRLENPIEFIDRAVYGKVGLGIKAVGFKLFYHQAHNPDWEAVWPHLLELNVHAIHLRRRNLLASLASLVKADQTKQWSTKAVNEPEARSSVTIDYDTCIKYFEGARAQHVAHKDLFPNTLEIWYEDIVAEFDKSLGAVQEFLGVPVQNLSSPLKKQSRGSLADRIDNFDELAARFANTEWAGFFE